VRKDVFVAGLLGSVVMFVWLFVSNAMIPLKSNMVHKIVPNQLEIHKVLKENIKEAGTYSCPYLSREEEDLLPDYRSQPVFSITYAGGTHGDPASISMLIPILIILVVPLIAAWMLSMTSENLLKRYSRRVLFVVLIGLIVSLYDDVLQMSFGPQPKDYLVFLAVNNFVTWILAGIVIAARIKPTVS
jgi:hypothetical protein